MSRASTSTWAALAAVAMALIIAHAAASAGQVKYAGAHPVATDEGGFCYIEFPHVHVYPPAKADVLYRVHDDHHHFVGDPVAFGYDGPKHAYYGHHPVVVDLSTHLHAGAPATEFCYIDGPHYHGYLPPPEVSFTVKGDAYWYTGKFPPAYHKHKKSLVKINTVYEPIVYTRPVVVVDSPPVGYVGPVLEVHMPVPAIELNIGVPGVVIERKHRYRYGKHKKYKKYKKHHRRGKHWH
jgi:hypothetical protein